MNMNTLVTTVLQASISGNEFHPTRNLNSVFNHVTSEVGELGIEINIVQGQSYKPPGSDGVVGEAIDAIIALLDLIYVAQPTITESDITAIAELKCTKWISKIKQHSEVK